MNERVRTYHFDHFELELSEHRLLRNGEEISLRPKCFEGLVFLVRNHGHLVSKEEILDAVWADTAVTENSLTHQMCELRKALRDDPHNPRYIKTIPRVGYKFIADVVAISASPGRGIEAASSESFGPSIAVLPFRDMSPHRDQDYLCEGVAEEIINTLAHAEQLRVVARTSSFSFKHSDADIREIGRQLNAETVLEGSVRKSGDRLRFAIQLISTADGFHSWSKEFESSMQDLFAMQDEIASEVAGELKVKLLHRKRLAIRRRHRWNAEAHSLFLRGRHLFYRESGEGLRGAIEHFEKAIEQDPDYALAHAWLSLSLSLSGWWNFLPSTMTFPKAKEAAEVAVRMDDELAEAHYAVGLISLFYDWDWPGAQRAAERAIELNPGSGVSRTLLAACFIAVGKTDEAVSVGREALAMDPISNIANAYLGWNLLRSGRLSEAVGQFRRTLELEPLRPQTRWFLGQALILEGRRDLGLREIERAAADSGQNSIILSGLGWAYAIVGRRVDARKVLTELLERSGREYVRPYFLAKILAGLAEIDTAFDCLERAFQEHDVSLAFVLTDETLANLHPDPRFGALLEKMGLAP